MVCVPRDRQATINILAHAHFVCEINRAHPTFIRKESEKTYTEPHHLISLSYQEQFDVSHDVEENIVSLCSNCHNEIHCGRDADRLIRLPHKERKDALAMAGIYVLFFCVDGLAGFKEAIGAVCPDSEKKGWSMRVRIVKNSGLTVCPYCNRDYINYRAEDISGAQLDHFFSKIYYPIFAVCLYNLVPVCGNCNRVKSDQVTEFASPFDETIQNNIKKMRIEEAYQIHDIEVEELLEKRQIYCQTQQQEFQEVLHKIKVSEQQIKLAVFGSKITKETMKTKPLSKMMSDMHEQLKIY